MQSFRDKLTKDNIDTREKLRMYLFKVHGCGKGNCLNCEETNCRIQYLKQQVKVKPSFCPGNPVFCARRTVTTCKQCRWDYMDLCVSDDNDGLERQFEYAEKHRPTTKELVKQLEELAALNKNNTTVAKQVVSTNALNKKDTNNDAALNGLHKENTSAYVPKSKLSSYDLLVKHGLIEPNAPILDV